LVLEQNPGMSRRPLPFIYEHATNLKTPAQEVFDFHLQPKNIARVNPPWIKVLSLDGPERLTPGAILKLRVASFGVPQAWEVRVLAVEDFSGTPAKASILDEAVKGPFPFWRHLHEFWQAPDGTTGLVDRVEFLPPGGAAGIVLIPGIKLMLKKMFEARHAATRRIFERA
jgi:ligand-binding SRPBCC domain-containing protein